MFLESVGFLTTFKRNILYNRPLYVPNPFKHVLLNRIRTQVHTWCMYFTNKPYCIWLDYSRKGKAPRLNKFLPKLATNVAHSRKGIELWDVLCGPEDERREE